MVERRLAAGGNAYRPLFDHAVAAVEDLLADSDDLSDLASVTTAKKHRAALRYLASPPISADDLKTIERSEWYARMPPAEALAALFGSLLDPLRFPWVAAGRTPTPEERRAAVRWTAGLWAVEVFRTSRRKEESREQELSVVRIVQEAGYALQGKSRSIDRPDMVEIGNFTREVVLGGLKCDLSVRLRDGRLMAIECKVSNSELNSVKRLIREAGGKARQWQHLFGQQVVTSAVLRGVFKPATVLDAQESYGLFIFWEHDLSPLRKFLKAAG